MGTASVRRGRKSNIIKNGDVNFSKKIKSKDYKSAAKILYWTTLKTGGKEGLLGALYDANSLIKRKKIRRGL